MAYNCNPSPVATMAGGIISWKLAWTTETPSSARDVAPLVEHLPSMHDAPGSICRAT